MVRFFKWTRWPGQRLPVRTVLAFAIVLALLFSFGAGLTLRAQSPGMGIPSSSAMFFVRGLMNRFMPVDSFNAQADINSRGDLMTAQSLPERTELVRLGNSWAVEDTTSVVDLTGVPTTTASLSFWNGEPDGGKSYVIDRVFTTVTTSAGAASAHTLFCLLNKGPVASPSGVSLTIGTKNGRNYPGKIVIARSATVTNDGWWPCPDQGMVSGAAAATTTIGLTVDSRINGNIVIPPRHEFSLALMGVNATEAGKFGMEWHEVQLPIVY